MFENMHDKKLRKELEKLDKSLDTFVEITGLKYDGSHWIASNIRDIEDDWIGVLSSIEMAHSDVKDFLEE